MAWGLVEPSIFGDYFQSGEYSGWEERLCRHFDEQMSDENKRNFSNSRAMYVSEVARKFRGDLGPIDDHEFPAEYKFSDKCKMPGSLMLLADGLLVVEVALKNIIESLDNNVHRFHKLNLLNRNGDGIQDEYYIIVIGGHIDSFEPKSSDCYRKDASFDFFYAKEDTRKCYSQISISKTKSKGLNLWRETKLRSPEIIMSDILKSSIDQKNLRIFRHYKIKEV